MADAPAQSSRIFISYRRDDTAGHVLALLPRLRQAFGHDQVFKDTDSIAPGQDFVEVIRRELESCSVLLAMIGREWLTATDAKGTPRIDDPGDFLRLEVTTALKNKNVLVIPVLVGRASMPPVTSLPAEMTELSRRNAFELSDQRWETDVDRLIDAIERARGLPRHQVRGPEGGPEGPDDTLNVLEGRRRRQIAQHVAAAREADEAGDFERVQEYSNEALMLDPQDAEARALFARALRILNERKIESLLADAGNALRTKDLSSASEQIDAALLIDPDNEAALAMRLELMEVRRTVALEREIARLIRLAQDRLKEEDFDAARQRIEEALEKDPKHAEALALGVRVRAAIDARRAERDERRRAQRAVDRARSEFAAGRHAEAIAQLATFAPPHPLVTAALDELTGSFQTLQREERIRTVLDLARSTLKDGRPADAIGPLEQLLQEVPTADGALKVLEEAREALRQREAEQEKAETEKRRQAALRLIADADAGLREHDLEAARAAIDRLHGFNPVPTEVGALDSRLSTMRAASETLARAKAALKAEDFETAAQLVNTVLASDGTWPEALGVRDQVAAARQQAARSSAAAARASADAGLRAFAPDAAKAAIDTLRSIASQDADLPALQSRLTALEQALAQLVEARAALERDDLTRASASVEGALAYDGTWADALRLRHQIQERVEANVARERQALERQALERQALERQALERQALEREALKREALERHRQEVVKATSLVRERLSARDPVGAQAQIKRLEELEPAHADLPSLSKSLGVLGTGLEQLQEARDALASGNLSRAEALVKGILRIDASWPDAVALRNELTRRSEEARLRKVQEQEQRLRSSREEPARTDVVSPTPSQATVPPSTTTRREPASQASDSAVGAVAAPRRNPRAFLGIGAAALVIVAGATWMMRSPRSPTEPPSAQTEPSPAQTMAPVPPAGTTAAPSNGTQAVAASGQAGVVGASDSSRSEVVTGGPAAERAADRQGAAGPGAASETNPGASQQLTELRSRATASLKRGQPAAALDAAARGLQAAPGDAVLTGLVDQLLRNAMSSANEARTKASAAGGARQGRFVRGDESMAAARRASDTGQKPTAVRELWAAEQHFRAAAVDAQQQTLLAQRQEAEEAAAARVSAQALERQALERQVAALAAQQRQALERQAAALAAQPEPEPPPPPPANDEANIRETLRLYADAYQHLDANAVRAIYPAAPMDRLTKAFSDFRSYSLQVQVNSLQIGADRTTATVNATLSYDFQPRTGRRSQGSRQQVFVLQKRANTWLIAQLP